jgi:hypothetical protein
MSRRDRPRREPEPVADDWDDEWDTVPGFEMLAGAEGLAAADYEWPGGFSTEPVTVRNRLSSSAAVGAVLVVVALCITLTGLMAPEGLALAIIAVMCCLFGVAVTQRPWMTGSGLAGFGLLCGLAAVVLAVLAMVDGLSWLNSGVDEVGRWHSWVTHHWPLLSHWSQVRGSR